MYCYIYAYTPKGLKQVKIYSMLGFAKFSTRWGCGTMNMNEAFGAVRWAHGKGWLTNMVDYG